MDAGWRRAKAVATNARQAAAAVQLLHVGDGVARIGRQALFGDQAAQLPPPRQLAVELCSVAARVCTGRPLYATRCGAC